MAGGALSTVAAPDAQAAGPGWVGDIYVTYSYNFSEPGTAITEVHTTDYHLAVGAASESDATWDASYSRAEHRVSDCGPGTSAYVYDYDRRGGGSGSGLTLSVTREQSYSGAGGELGLGYLISGSDLGMFDTATRVQTGGCNQDPSDTTVVQQVRTQPGSTYVPSPDPNVYVLTGSGPSASDAGTTITYRLRKADCIGVPDTDSDGFDDCAEFDARTNPGDPTSHPAGGPSTTSTTTSTSTITTTTPTTSSTTTSTTTSTTPPTTSVPTTSTPTSTATSTSTTSTPPATTTTTTSTTTAPPPPARARLKLTVTIDYTVFWQNAQPNISVTGRPGSDSALIRGSTTAAVTGNAAALRSITSICLTPTWTARTNKNYTTVPVDWQEGGRDLMGTPSDFWQTPPASVLGNFGSRLSPLGAACSLPGSASYTFSQTARGPLRAQTNQLGENMNLVRLRHDITVTVTFSDGQTLTRTLGETESAPARPPVLEDLDESRSWNFRLG